MRSKDEMSSLPALAISAPVPDTAPPGRFRRVLRGQAYAAFASGLFIVLLGTTAAIDPHLLGGQAIAGTLGGAAPLVLAAIAETPVVLAGGIDLSVGPLMGLVNAIIVAGVIGSANMQSPVVIVPAALGIGLVSGLLNGVLVVGLRLQPIVVTLGTYLAYSGFALNLLPQPAGSVPPWLASLAGSYNGVPMAPLVVAVVLVAWLAVTRRPLYEQLIAVGSNDRVAYASGIAVSWVRLTAYAMSGIGGAVAGLAITALLSAGEPSASPPYTLTAIAAVALGGTSLTGGRGGMLGAVVGALNIFLIQTVLTHFNASPFLIELTYGLVLVVAVILNTTLGRRWSRA